MTPHPYQTEYLNAIREGWTKGFRRQLVVSPTGSGKTCMFSWLTSEFIREFERVLILVDQDELVWQTQRKIQDICKSKCDVEKAEHVAGKDAGVVVGSVQTLMRQARLQNWSREHFGLVIADEADKSISPSWQSVLNHFEQRAKVCGFTATPHRTDQRNLGSYYDNSIEIENLFSLIKKGFLAPISIQMLPIKLDLSGHGSGRDYTEQEADEIISPHLEEIAKAIRDYAAFRRTLVFLPLIKTCEMFNTIARDLGLASDYVYGQDAERAEKIQRFRNYEFDVLANSMLLTRGVDIPEVDCIVPCRPTKSVTLYFQIVGRGTRLAPGKQDCLLLDFLYQATKKMICRPAHLIAHGEDEAEQITKLLSEPAAGLPGDVIEQLDLIEVAAQASTQREEALRKKLEEQKNKSAKFVSAEQFALEHHALDAAEFEPTMPWHDQPVTEKQEKWLSQAHIDVASVKGKGHASVLLDLFFKNKPVKLASNKARFAMKQLGSPNWHHATEAEARRFFAERNRKGKDQTEFAQP